MDSAVAGPRQEEPPDGLRGIATGSKIESRNRLWFAAKSSRLGRSSVSKKSCHDGLGGLVAEVRSAAA